MEKMNELLDKYFKGETTLEQEKELKNYFIGTNIAEKHKPYQALFDVFAEELEDKACLPLKKVWPKQQSVKRLWIKAFSYSGIAATILIVLWIQRPQQSDNYAIVSGNRIEDPDYAQKYAEKKFSKVNEILKNSMQPMKSIETVRQSLQPMQKIGKVQKQTDEVENNIQLK